METDDNQQRVTFKLWHIFALVTFAACLITLFQRSLILAILTSISVFPALVTLVGVSRLRGYFVNGSIICRISLVATLCFAWLSFYILSSPPIHRLTHDYVGNGWEDWLYWPIIWLHERTVLEKPLEWYMRLWIKPFEWYNDFV